MSILTAPPTPIPRDRYGRPLIIPPNGGKPVAYTRATTVAETTDDRYNLEKWKMRQVAVGLADRPDLLLAVTAHRHDKTELDRLCQQALEVSKSSAGATTGTAIHALTEVVDRREDLPVIPEPTQADLAAYQQATARFNVVAIEQFLVVDQHKIGGTADRIVEWDGRRYIADLKTGSTVSYSMGAIAQQLAIYSRGAAYDPSDGTRTPIDVDQDVAIVIHLPAGQGVCHLHKVNIGHGWEAALLSLRVRAYRKHARNSLSQTL